jgi:hypothetical protein
MTTISQTHLSITENELYDTIIKKLDHIKNKIIKLKDYSNSFESDTKANKNITFLEKFSSFSTELNNMKALVNDMYDEFILESNPTELSNEDSTRLNTLLIEKKIQTTFLPYILYFRILLNNLTE